MQAAEDASEKILSAVPQPKAESIKVASANGRCLTEDIRASVNLPPFDNSAMDGYAVQSADVKNIPTGFRLIGEAPAGQSFPGQVGSGECVRIFTGSPIPEGADAVIMQEDTDRDGDTVKITDTVKPFEHIRLRGEDIKAGQTILASGNRITPGTINLLLASGVAEVKVARRPVIGLLATGDELKTAGEALAPGQIYESNRHMLAAQVRQAGCEARVFDLVPDTLEDTRNAISKAFEECDAVITTGGVSVGDHDHVKAAFTSVGGNLDFWRVRIKPGKPFVYGTLNGRFLYGLPGNPVSAFVTFMVLVRPALLRWQGANDIGLPAHPAVLQESLVNRGDRRHFMRLRVDNAGNATSAGVQASHMLHSLSAANALIDVPPGETFEAGQIVTVQRFDF